MDRIQHASAAPGNLFTEGDPGLGTPATTVTDTWLNHLQEELCLLIEYAGLTLDSGDDEQVRQAFETLNSSGRSGTTTNTGDAYVLNTTPNPSFETLTAGMAFFVTFNSTNAGASTLNINGTGVKSVVQKDGSTAIGAGEVTATKTSIVLYDGTSYRLLISAIDAFSSTDITGQTAAAPAVGDKIVFADISDSEALKRTTYQDILNLILSVATEYTKTQNFNATTLTDAANIAWDASSNQVTSVTLTDNRTLDNPTNMVDGGTYVLTVKQDGTGTRTLAYGSAYKFPGASVPVLSTGINDVDILTFVSDGTNMYGVSQLDFS